MVWNFMVWIFMVWMFHVFVSAANFPLQDELYSHPKEGKENLSVLMKYPAANTMRNIIARARHGCGLSNEVDVQLVLGASLSVNFLFVTFKLRRLKIKHNNLNSISLAGM